MARQYGVSHATASRWLTEAGLLGADPGGDPVLLRELYVAGQFTTREVAAELGISKSRVIRALAVAGIPRRPRAVRPPRGARAAVTDTALAEVYHRPGMTIARAAQHFGVSDEYLRRRTAEAGLTRRPGTFAPRTAWSPPVLQARAVQLCAAGDDHAGGGRPAIAIGAIAARAALWSITDVAMALMGHREPGRDPCSGNGHSEP